MARKLKGGAIQANTVTVTQLAGALNDTSNASYAQANSAHNQANTAYGQANTARTTANDAYGQANVAYGQANSAYGAANNRVLKAGDTMTGQLNISSGGLLVTGNVGIGTTSPQSKLEVATSSGDFSHFGATSAANGQFTGITLGYRENNSSYRKAAIVQEQIGDNSARGHLHLLVDTADDTGTVVLGDSKLMIHGTTGKVGVGTSSFNTNGGKLQVADGISFPATQSACSDANTLDDYEEGTWTPELRDGATALTQGYSYRSGVYHKIGRMVHIHFGFLLSSLSGTGTGALRVYGLPFTGATTGGYQEPMGYAILGYQPTAAHSNQVYFFNGTGSAYLEARLLNGADTVYTSNNIDGDTFMKFSMIYWV